MSAWIFLASMTPIGKPLIHPPNVPAMMLKLLLLCLLERSYLLSGDGKKMCH